MPKNFHLVKHPLIQHKLSLLRDKNTPSPLFRDLLHEITLLLAYEATRHLPTIHKKIATPLETTRVPLIDMDLPVVILPILRAGLGMVGGLLSLMPWAKVGHIGIYRDEKTFQPQTYYFKVPVKPNKKQYYFICDPMLATGGSIIATIDRLKEIGIKKIIFICVIAAPEGVKNLRKHHADVPIFTAGLDRQLNKNSYILPGLGDAGDRLFGTK